MRNISFSINQLLQWKSLVCEVLKFIFGIAAFYLSSITWNALISLKVSGFLAAFLY